MKAYSEQRLKKSIRRIFKYDVEDEELKWHRDFEDRKIIIKSGTNWKLQLDNSLPIVLQKNKKYNIPKGIYHRIIKGQDDLIIDLII